MLLQGNSQNERGVKNYAEVFYTRKIMLLFLMMSTIAIWLGTLIILQNLFNIEFITLTIPFIVSAFYFIKVKNKFIIKSNFRLSHQRLVWQKGKIDFDNVQSYKIRWMQGAEINFKLKNGKHIKISANDFFCDAQKFVRLCKDIDELLQEKYAGVIVRKKTFYETIYGYYFAILMTILVILLTIYKIIMNQEIKLQKLFLILFSLGIVWSGVRRHTK